MTRAESRSPKHREVVEAIVVRNEPVVLVARIYSIPRRTVFDWPARYRSGGWGALKEGSRRGRPRKLSGEGMQWVYDAVTMGKPAELKVRILSMDAEHHSFTDRQGARRGVTDLSAEL